MELIPAIDLRGGRVVRLLRGDDARRTAYPGRPGEVLAAFTRAGARRLHLVDLDAAFGGAPQRALIERLARRAESEGAEIQLGGGLRDETAVVWALGAGCGRVVLGSLVAREPGRFARLAERHAGRVVPAVDVDGDTVRIAGWTEGAGRPVDDLCRELRGLPCPAVLVTDVARDGTLEGPNPELALRVAEASGTPALLSGGVASLEDLARAALAGRTSRVAGAGGIAGAVVGKALHEGLFTVEEALAACRGEVPV